MKKKIMLLVLILPLLFMLSLFTLGKAAGLYVKIPASGIKITTQNENGFIDIDLAGYGNDLYIKAEVEPLSAANRAYSFNLSATDGTDISKIQIDENGRVLADGVGRAKVTVTSQDNGFTDSVILNIYSSKIVDITPTVKNVAGVEQPLTAEGGAYSASLKSGAYDFSALAYPSEFQGAECEWTSDNVDVLEINSVTGKAKAKLSGSASVQAVVASGADGDIVKTIYVTVERAQTQSGITVNGMDNPLIYASSNQVVLLAETDAAGGGIELVSGVDYIKNILIENLNESISNKQYRITIELNDGVDEARIGFAAGGETQTVTLKKAAFAFDVYTAYHTSGDGVIYQKNGASVRYAAYSDITDDNVSYVWTIDNKAVLTADGESGAYWLAQAVQEGQTELYVSAYDDKGTLLSQVVKTICIVTPVLAIDFADNAKTYGIADLLAVGDTVYKNGRYIPQRPQLDLRARTADGVTGYSENTFEFEVSDINTAKVFLTTNSFNLDIVSSGVVKVKARWKYAEYFGTDISAEITVRTVKDGVLVATYEDLVRATEDGKKVVLQNDIMLGKEGATQAELESYAKKMPTTYNWKYYENQGKTQPNVYYLIEFKNDVYGNGYTLNADYIAAAEDSVGVPLLFRGPLDFVAIATAAVKAQDNISFLVRTDGVIIDNVVLKSCSDDKLTDENGFDLNALNYVGTTLEIAADCTLVNSRVSNGRTGVRVYGGGRDGFKIYSSADLVPAAAEDSIKVDIESCVLTNAREFILKLGSNAAVMFEGSSESTFNQTLLKTANGGRYNPQAAANAADEYFYSRYVTTDVTLKNSVLATSGLFAVGVETHFSGIMLAGVASSVSINNWKNLAATSLASVLRLEGDVKMLDWKPLSGVDSSTLIEAGDGIREFLKLDIPKMIEKVYYDAETTQYENILTDYNGENYVHGGIAFYGGGYNYSYLDTSECLSEGLSRYNINLSALAKNEETTSTLYLQGTMLPLAAGAADFRFYIYDAASDSDANWQQSLIGSGRAYDVPAAQY